MTLVYHHNNCDCYGKWISASSMNTLIYFKHFPFDWSVVKLSFGHFSSHLMMMTMMSMMIQQAIWYIHSLDKHKQKTVSIEWFLRCILINYSVLMRCDAMGCDQYLNDIQSNTTCEHTPIIVISILGNEIQCPFTIV